jgi:hypothetical protein
MAGQDTQSMMNLLDKQPQLIANMLYMWSGSKHLNIRCPACGFENVHLNGKPELIDGEDSYVAWEGRGDAVRIPMLGECGHQWDFCLGFHKGTLHPFIKNMRLTEEN